MQYTLTLTLEVEGLTEANVIADGVQDLIEADYNVQVTKVSVCAS